MAGLDPTLVFHEYTPTQYQAANDASNLSQAQTTGVGLENTIRQQQIDQNTMALNAQKMWDSLIAKNTSTPNVPTPNAPGSPTAPATPGGTLPTDAMGNPVASLAAPPSPNPTGPGNTPPVQAGDVIPAPASEMTLPVGQIGLPGEAPPQQPAQATASSTTPSAPAPVSAVAAMPVTKWDAVISGMYAAGYPSVAIAKDKQLQEALKIGLENHNLSLEGDQKKLELMGAALAGLPVVDQTAAPDVQNVQKSQWQAASIAALQMGLKQGWIDPQYEQALVQQVSPGWNPQIDAQIKGMASQAKGYAGILEAHIKQAQAPMAALIQGAEYTGKTLSNAEKQKDADASILGAAKDAADYATKYDSLPPDRAKLFPAPAEWDAKTSPNQIRHVGMTSEQQMAEGQRQATLASSNEFRSVMADQRQQVIDLREAQKGKESAADKAAARQAGEQLMSLQQKERNTYQSLNGLSSQIALGNSGQPFYKTDDKGKIIGNYALQPSSPEGVAALTEMKQYARGAYDRATDIVDDKYDLLDQHGATPTVSREDAKAKLDTGRSGIEQWGKAATAPETKPTTPAPAKQTTKTPAPVVTPAPTPQPKSGGPLKLLAPDNKTVLTFDNTEKRDAFLKAHGLSLKQ